VAVGFVILVFSLRAGLGSAGPLFERGSADAVRMLHGEWWRAVTALTLHADLEHVAANAVAIAIFLGAVARRLGPAVATWATLAAGVAGNFATALALPGGHVSIGASTAVFGALGILSMLQVPRRSAWLTLGAGVALLGLLGTGARSDLLAHLFGFTFGLLEGLALRRMSPPRASLLQPAIALLAVLPIAFAWWTAGTALPQPVVRAGGQTASITGASPTTTAQPMTLNQRYPMLPSAAEASTAASPRRVATNAAFPRTRRRKKPTRNTPSMGP
jgi:membrane associated rhomboid family serine protease